jgi:hypothetical protein
MVLFGPRETYQKSRISKTMTTFLEPFSGELWALVLAGLVISSLIMYHLEAEDNPAFRCVQTDVMGKETGGGAEGKKKKLGEASEPSDVSMELLDGLFFSLYLSLTGFTGAGGHSPVTRAGRVYQISWSFVILVVVAGYTANLGECSSHRQSSMHVLCHVLCHVLSPGSFAELFVASLPSHTITTTATTTTAATTAAAAATTTHHHRRHRRRHHPCSLQHRSSR